MLGFFGLRHTINSSGILNIPLVLFGTLSACSITVLSHLDHRSGWSVPDRWGSQRVQQRHPCQLKREEAKDQNENERSLLSMLSIRRASLQ